MGWVFLLGRCVNLMGDAMTPTNRLRWLRREAESDCWTEYFGIKIGKTEKVKQSYSVLQQFWAEYDAFGAQITGEWRDVELKDERTN